jgi:hypothetical protein
MSNEQKPEPKQPTDQKPTSTPTRPNTGRTAGEIWIAEARIVPVEDTEL